MKLVEQSRPRGKQSVADAPFPVESFRPRRNRLVADVKECPPIFVKITWARLRDCATSDSARLVN